MRQFLLVVFSLWWGYSFAQTSTHPTYISKKVVKQAQEDEWAKSVFNEGYSKQKYEKHSGKIKLDSHRFIFEQTVITVEPIDLALRNIISSGLIYPQLFDMDLQKADTLRLSGLKELGFLSNDSSCKRFSLSCLRKGSSKPTTYFIELTNLKASRQTSLQTFIKDASLTFFTEAWTEL